MWASRLVSDWISQSGYPHIIPGHFLRLRRPTVDISSAHFSPKSDSFSWHFSSIAKPRAFPLDMCLQLSVLDIYAERFLSTDYPTNLPWTLSFNCLPINVFPIFTSDFLYTGRIPWTRPFVSLSIPLCAYLEHYLSLVISPIYLIYMYFIFFLFPLQSFLSLLFPHYQANEVKQHNIVNIDLTRLRFSNVH